MIGVAVFNASCALTVVLFVLLPHAASQLAIAASAMAVTFRRIKIPFFYVDLLFLNDHCFALFAARE
ncbi:MAG: hypothetical protein V4793_13620 [Paraburkholderia tropica]|uniref:hypothetical protein n=1 Tax=Paraburkholderia TaxID=1822464 RepID=UPI0017B69716|nr:hypothetical protein [Paraburkholderia tropica]MBB3003878.1 hypothetical protein [Paraburkholderia tropica]MBB6322722.1 hypothetical protein [Paraburkholderia tropica]MDE1144182.1 hypothetical protein [Paraburkholderia tropica]